MQSVTGTGLNARIVVPIAKHGWLRIMINAQKVKAKAEKPILALVRIVNIGLAPVLAQRIDLHRLLIHHFNRSV